MVSEKTILEAARQLQGSGKTFAEFLAEIFKGQFIEVYVGDSYEEISVEQISQSYPAVFCGKVVGAYRECLILSCAYVENKVLKSGNLLFVNERAIRALSEVDNKGTLEDMMLRSKESLEVKTSFGE
ncbi:MAG: hypothetical protein HC877_24320 [Thioploca sp.]|nr:hypothetical protein [Thioploca sp.]